MKFLKVPASPVLRPFVRNYWYIEVETQDLPLSELSFSYGSHDLVCYLENPNFLQWAGSTTMEREPEIFYSGQLLRPFTMHFDRPSKCVGVSFYPWNGNLLYQTPAHVFTQELVHLSNLDKSDALYQQLRQSSSPRQMFMHLEQYLEQKLDPERGDNMVAHLARTILSVPDRYSAKKAIDKIGLSRRRIEQRFITATGLTIGAYTRKIRFQKAIGLLGNNSNLTQTGLEAGYYDQSHFVSEFKTFAGCTPGVFSKQAGGLKEVLKKMII